MDQINLLILIVGIALILGGARMLYCGHRATDGRRGERRSTDRRRAA